MEEEVPMPPPSGGWTGQNIAIVVILLVVTNAVTGTVVFLSVPQVAPPPPPGPPAATIKVIHPWSGGERDLFLPVLENFTALTGIKVEDITFRQENLQPILPILFASGTTNADVIIGTPPGFIRAFGEQGHLEDVSDIVTPADYFGDAAGGVSIGNAIYGAPFTGKIKPGFWYKQSTFAANPTWNANPATFADFMDLLATVKGAGTVPIVNAADDWPLGDLTEYVIATYGGAAMFKGLIDGTVAFNSTGVFNALNGTVDDMVAKGYFDTPVEWTLGVQDVISDKNALYFQGSWLPTMFPALADPNDWRVISLPQGVADQGVVFVIDYMMIPKYSGLVPEARQFAQYLTGAAGQNVQIAQGGHLLTHLSGDATLYPTASSESAQAALDAAAGREVLVDLDDTIGTAWQVETWFVQLELFYAGTITLKAALDEIEAKRP